MTSLRLIASMTTKRISMLGRAATGATAASGCGARNGCSSTGSFGIIFSNISNVCTSVHPHAYRSRSTLYTTFGSCRAHHQPRRPLNTPSILGDDSGEEKCDNSEKQTYQLYRHRSLKDIETNPPALRFSEYDDTTLAIMASQRVHGAFKERMLREVMRRDKLEYGEAYAVLAKLNEANEQLIWLFKMPYQLGIATTLFFGLASVPCVFHRGTALWFCKTFVKEEIPTDAETLDTFFKVGTWTWQWMEPAIGTASFVLLSFQLIRSHMQKIDLKPLGSYIESRRADQLAKKFPRYEREIVRDYAKSDPWGRDDFIARQGHPANSVIPHRL